MFHPPSRAETGLFVGLSAALLLAILGPGVAQVAGYHTFADQRAMWGLPYAMDVLSNLPFFAVGLFGLFALRRPPAGPYAGSQTALAALFFTGLMVTAGCSAWYHLHPDNAGLAIDRMGMVVAFAGLLALATVDRVSDRAGMGVAAAVLVSGPLAVMDWSLTGNLLPWAVLQGGGMVLLLVLGTCKVVPGAWGIPVFSVVAWYVLAKFLELGDHIIFDASLGHISGHTLKHCAAAMAAWPVIKFMHNGAQFQGRQQAKVAIRLTA